jgi:cytochrome P450
MIINGHTKDVGQDVSSRIFSLPIAYPKNQVISGHLMGMIFAFHANTAGTFAWALLRLANHKEAREKVIKEYQDNIAKGVSTFDINNFPYLKAVILETNRRYGAFMTLRYDSAFA